MWPQDFPRPVLSPWPASADEVAHLQQLDHVSGGDAFNVVRRQDAIAAIASGSVHPLPARRSVMVVRVY